MWRGDRVPRHPASPPPPLHPSRRDPGPAPFARKGQRAERRAHWLLATLSSKQGTRAEGQRPPAQTTASGPRDRPLMTPGGEEGLGGQREASWASGRPRHAGVGGPLPAAHGRRQPPLDPRARQAGLGTGPGPAMWIPAASGSPVSSRPVLRLHGLAPSQPLPGRRGSLDVMSTAGAGYRSLSPPRPPLCPATSPAHLLSEPRLQPQTRTEATDPASWRVVMSAPWDTLGDSPSDVQEGSNVPRAAAFTVTAARPTGALGQH